MFETSNRPLKEIRFKKNEMDTSQLNEIKKWADLNAQFNNSQGYDEYLLLIPHPKHLSLGGQSFEEFTENCPLLLKDILTEIYESRTKQMQDEKWTSEFDLENDFGFILVAIL